jgi:hypothetical protein
VSSRRRAVVVVGVSRSGTSAMTRSLRALGVELGDNLLAPSPDNPTGYFEDLGFLDLDNRVLAAHGCDIHTLVPRETPDWDDPAVAALLDEATAYVAEATDRAAPHPRGFKDPRATLLLNFWSRAFERASCEGAWVLMVRHPLSVAASLDRREAMPPDIATLLWLEYVVLALRGLRHHRCVVVDYDRLLGGVATQLDRVAAALDLPRPDPAELAALADYLDPSLRHSAIPLDRPCDSPLDPMLGELQRLVRSLAEGELAVSDDAVAAVVDPMWERVRGWWPALAVGDRRYEVTGEPPLRGFELSRLVGQLKAEIASLQGWVASREEALEFWRDNCDRWEASHQALAAERDALAGQVRELRGTAEPPAV